MECISRPLPASLDEYLIGDDENRPLREDERNYPHRIYVFSGEPTVYAQWLTKRVVRDCRGPNTVCSWDVPSIITAFITYQTLTSLMIVREMAAVDSIVVELIIERLTWNLKWDKYSQILVNANILSDTDVSRLKTEIKRKEQQDGEKAKEKEDHVKKVMATAIIEAFFIKPTSSLFNALVEMQKGGTLVVDFIENFIQTNPYYVSASPQVLRALIAHDAFWSDRYRLGKLCGFSFS